MGKKSASTPKVKSTNPKASEPKTVPAWVQYVVVPLVGVSITAAVALIVAFHSSGGDHKTPDPTPTTSLISATSAPPSSPVSSPVPAGNQTTTISPTSGPVGTTITVKATGFVPGEQVKVELDQLANVTHFEGPYGAGNVWHADESGNVLEYIQVPPEVCCSGAKLSVTVTSVRLHTEESASAEFSLTAS